MSNTKSHTVYKLKSGKRVPGTTTITGLLEKRALHHWIARITKEGQDWEKYRDDKGSIGTLVHGMIMAELKDEEVDTDDYTQKQIDQAENSYISWLEWRKGKDIKPLLIEEELVSEAHKYGGTPDLLAYIDGALVLSDYKTGGIYIEHVLQGAAYANLVKEHGFPLPDRLQILGVPRDEDETFREVNITNYQPAWGVFWNLLQAYEGLKKVKL